MEQFIDNLITCLYTTCISLFVAFCMQKYMILRAYNNWLWIHLKYNKRNKCTKFTKIKLFLGKILGICVYCTNPYITGGFMVITTEFTLINWLCIISINNLLLRLCLHLMPIE